jgi:hypothetical protein
MRNVFHLLLIALSTVLASEHVMAMDMGDLEVTIRVIDAGKERAGDIGNRLELPTPPAHKAESPKRGENRERVEQGDKDELSEGHENDRPHADRERHDARDDHSMEHHDNAKENHDRVVDQYQHNKEERNDALDSREELKERLDGARGDSSSASHEGIDD